VHSAFEGRIRFVAAPGMLDQTIADEVDQPRFRDLLGFP